MPNIDDLFDKHGQQIAEEAKAFQGALHKDVPRDPVRRPWNGLNEGVDSMAAGAKSEAWYNSWGTIGKAMRENAMAISLTMLISLATLVTLAQFIPSTYNSNLHLYAPEKSDTISSRLPLFANRVEFASFPVDNKIPLALVARRLKAEPARAWVVEQYLKRGAQNSVAIDPATVNAETFYAEGSELLVIAGYANDPQIAADVTNLYWDYLENEIQKMRLGHLEKINQWIELTTVSLNQRMTSLAQELAQVSAVRPIEAKSQVHAKLAENYADLEMKRLHAVKERDEFRGALEQGPEDRIWLVSNPEIQELREINDALKKQPAEAAGISSESKRAEIHTQAIERAKTLLEEKTREIASIQEQTVKLRTQLNIFQGDDSTSVQGSRLRELLRQQAEYQSQSDELERLKTQLGVESAMTQTRLRQIQAAAADPSSRRPLLVLKYSVCFFAALFLSLMLLIWLQRKKSLLLPRPRSRRASPAHGLDFQSATPQDHGLSL